MKTNSGGRRAAGVLLVMAVAVGAMIGCGGPVVEKRRAGQDKCALLDSLFDSSGFEAPVLVEGKATVDANDYHMRGKIRLDAGAPGEVVFEFASTILFGNQREDFVFSVHEDTLRIVDRERGAYYEGLEAEEFLAESMETDFDVAAMMFLALGGHPPCDELTDVSIKVAGDGGFVCTGRHLGDAFRLDFEGRGPRLRTAEWPVRSDRYRDDRLRIDYSWEDAGGERPVLKEIVIWLEMREWRCKIQAGSGG